MGRFEIRKSTPPDIEAIHAWLREEESRGIDGNFLCNWNLTYQAHKDSNLLVCIDRETGEPVAYQWGGLLNPGVLQVRSGVRRSGIGRKLVEHCIAQARRRNETLLHIQCKPASSIAFWTKMGFTVNDVDGNATRILEKRNRLPRGGTLERVTIEVFPEARKYEHTTPPTRVRTPAAQRYPDGSVQLAERVAFFAELSGRGGDVVVRITVADNELYLDKAKYEEARSIGVRPCHNGWFIDTIQHPR